MESQVRECEVRAIRESEFAEPSREQVGSPIREYEVRAIRDSELEEPRRAQVGSQICECEVRGIRDSKFIEPRRARGKTAICKMRLIAIRDLDFGEVMRRKCEKHEMRKANPNRMWVPHSSKEAFFVKDPMAIAQRWRSNLSQIQRRRMFWEKECKAEGKQ